MTAANRPPAVRELGATEGALGWAKLEARLGSGVRDIERVQQEREQRKTWQERHEWIGRLLEERPDVTVGENRRGI